MLSRETARIVCFMAFLFGAFMLARGPVGGPLTTTFRLLLLFGGGIGVLLLGLPYRQGQDGPSPQPQAEPTCIDDTTRAAQDVSPKWAGNPEGKRRRLVIVFVALVVVAAGLIMFALARQGQ